MKMPIDTIFKKTILNVIECLLSADAKMAIKYLDKDKIVRASRRAFKGKFSKGNIEIILTIGKPNYAEREFIKKCKNFS